MQRGHSGADGVFSEAGSGARQGITDPTPGVEEVAWPNVTDGRATTSGEAFLAQVAQRGDEPAILDGEYAEPLEALYTTKEN